MVSLLLLVPTMIWVRLRLPWLQRVIEFLCLLPLTIPAIVLVVGLAPVYLWVTVLLRRLRADPVVRLRHPRAAVRVSGRSTPGCAAIDVQTLSEAARSLGARLAAP